MSERGFELWKVNSVLFAGFAKLLLNLADAFLHLSLDLLRRVALDRAGDVVDFAFNLFSLSRCNIFTSHDGLLEMRVN